MAARAAARDDPNSGGRAGAGAICCDNALFGYGIYEAAARATGRIKTKIEGNVDRRNADGAETEPLLQAEVKR